MSHLFPQYHLRPPRGFINDPNGPIIVGDTLHLFFQNRPTVNISEPVQWGHAASNDFVRWNLHRPAMVPDPTGLDRDGCFSGNAVATADGIRAFYSGLIEGKPFQSVLTALSTDGGRSFGTPSQVIPDPQPEENVVMFRDPFVWSDGDGWNMAVGAELIGETAAVRLYTSPDLAIWEPAGNLVQRTRTQEHGLDSGAGWECPQVLTIDGTDTVVVAAWSQAGLSGHVLAVDDGGNCVRRLDAGSNFYAPSILRDSPFGTVMFGWVTEGSDASLWQERGWAGMISLPRTITRAADGSLLSDPLPSIDSLQQGPGVAADGVRAGSAFELVLPHTTATTRVRFGQDEWFDIDVDLASDTLTVNRDRASVAPNAHRGVLTIRDAFDASRRESAARVFVDGSVVEVFTSAGRVLTTRIYPTSAPPWRIDAPHDATLHHLSARTAPQFSAEARLLDSAGMR